MFNFLTIWSVYSILNSLSYTIENLLFSTSNTMVYRSSNRLFLICLRCFSICYYKLEPIQYLDLLLPQLQSNIVFSHQPRISEEFQTRSFPESNEIRRHVTSQRMIKVLYLMEKIGFRILNLYSPI